MGYPSGSVATRIANDLIEKFKPQEIQDTHLLYVHAHGPGIVATKKPVRTLDELKGLKVRTTGYSGNIIKALGITKSEHLPDLDEKEVQEIKRRHKPTADKATT